MIVFDNIIFSLQRTGGISVYWQKLLENATVSGRQFKVLERHVSSDMNRVTVPENQRINILGQKLPLWIDRYLPIAFLDRNIDLSSAVFHSSYYRTPLFRKSFRSNVVTVFDFVYEHYASGLKRMVHSRQKYSAIRNADVVICISHNTAKDVSRFVPESSSKIEVVHLGADERFTPYGDTHHESAPYLLWVGGRKSYKNFEMLASFWAGQQEYDLIMVGGEPLTDRELALLNSNTKRKWQRMTGLTVEELSSLYRGAFTLAYLSQYEGFGIPMIEAMRCRCPVVGVDTAISREVTGGNARLIPKNDESRLEEDLNFLKSSHNRESIVNAGEEWSRRFSWDRTCTQTFDIYDSLLAR